MSVNKTPLDSLYTFSLIVSLYSYKTSQRKDWLFFGICSCNRTLDPLTPETRTRGKRQGRTLPFAGKDTGVVFRGKAFLTHRPRPLAPWEDPRRPRRRSPQRSTKSEYDQDDVKGRVFGVRTHRRVHIPPQDHDEGHNGSLKTLKIKGK